MQDREEKLGAALRKKEERIEEVHYYRFLQFQEELEEAEEGEGTVVELRAGEDLHAMTIKCMQ